MKTPLYYFCTLLLAGGLSLHADEVLISKDHNNGGFESEELSPWMTNSGEPGITRETATVKEGKGAARVSLTGKPDGRASGRLFQNVDATAQGGRHFTIAMDVQVPPEAGTPRLHTEIVFLRDSGPKVVTFSNAEINPGGEWQHVELLGAEPAPEDWAEGKIQIRVAFYVDHGESTQTYEALVDNVDFIQSEKTP